MLFKFFLVVHAVIAAALVGVILVQKSEGGGFTSSGNAGGLVSVRGAANLLTRATAVLATLFVVLSIFLSALATMNRAPKELDTSLKSSAAAPGVPGLPQMGGTPAAVPGATPGTPAGTLPAALPAGTTPTPQSGVPLGDTTHNAAAAKPVKPEGAPKSAVKSATQHTPSPAKVAVPAKPVEAAAKAAAKAAAEAPAKPAAPAAAPATPSNATP